MSLSPTPTQLAPLRRFERAAFRLIHAVNRRHLAKELIGLYLRGFGSTWVNLCIRRLLRVDGLEHLASLDGRQPVLLVSNHRSFFDQYVISCVLARRTRLPRRLYFPVRADFFYERLSGLLLNAALGGFCMYPPFFRQAEKRDFNRYTTERIVELLREPGTLVGIHPEGRRGKGPDPYALLPAQPGVGKIVMDARPTVVPCFINGLSNDFARQVRSNFDGTGQPLILCFGPPVALDAFYAQASRLAVHKRLADHLLDVIRGLGAREQALRAGEPRRPEAAA